MDFQSTSIYGEFLKVSDYVDQDGDISFRMDDKTSIYLHVDEVEILVRHLNSLLEKGVVEIE